MSISTLLSELNDSQRAAATLASQHALILAGAGCGKTKTITARAAYLISSGTPAKRIQILTFTRRAAAEIVERVKVHLGDEAQGLRASTFHTWCISLIRRAPAAFGCKGFSVIDRDDQVQLFRVLRGKGPSSPLPTASQLCDIYSYARNTGRTLLDTLTARHPDALAHAEETGRVMLAYEERKRSRQYLDYDDILDVVAHRLATSPDTRRWVASQYDHVLVDEMQDTNPLQWKLLDPLKEQVILFCVGDDAQSIYAFRGADFRNVHSFGERVPSSVMLKLEQNYRSTQEILDVSNWLLEQSPLEYNKRLEAVRGSGSRPQLRTFSNEWEESRWIAEDLVARRTNTGAPWADHMILVRSSYAARAVEAALLAKDIPYVFIGGTKLLESAHIKDVLSVLRLVANPQDEIGWMRFLRLWKGVGDVTATSALDVLLVQSSIQECITTLRSGLFKIPHAAARVIENVKALETDVAKAFASAVQALLPILEEAYRNQDWDKRRKDFRLVEQLARKHTSILSFIEEYLLDPLHGSQVERLQRDDVVTLITIHSAKGTESRVCYVVNVSPGSYPSQYAIDNQDEVEEERRVLYVAMTRAKDELIVTRHGFSFWAQSNPPTAAGPQAETYFLNQLPEGLLDEQIRESGDRPIAPTHEPLVLERPGISLGFSVGGSQSRS